ncbi:hypothetical protein [Aureimonas glaciei]|uniref:DUF4760 domain-containing protein n=1 Tax=Aureimonas glaciei TaxID=1776957 RepID=A0A916XZJ8_9HYPH|nr:hypothetical protein [Aureimonas glaciei]GGD24326.1 hypothetical protein GCM10011335_29060 [Aureimonas glaciei]
MTMRPANVRTIHTIIVAAVFLPTAALAQQAASPEAASGPVWGSVPDWLSALANLILAVAAWLAAGAWKKQMRGQRKLAVAEETMVQFYEVRALLETLRPELGEFVGFGKPEDKPALFEVVRKRIENASDTMSAFYAKRFVAVANLGKPVETDFKKMHAIYLRMRMCARMLALDLEGTDSWDIYGEAVFRSPNNAVTEEIDGIVERVEATFEAAVDTEMRLPKGFVEAVVTYAFLPFR